MEDLLTGNVFGLWRYVPASLGLGNILRAARRADGTRLAVAEEFTLQCLEFWPWLQVGAHRGIEPDVLLRLRDTSDRVSIILVEAKFHSGKSSLKTPDGPPNDQLAKQMVNLRLLAKRESADSYALVYLTADMGFPSRSIRESIEELDAKTQDGSEESFFWTNWRAIRSEFTRFTDSRSTTGVEENLVKDVIAVLDHLGLSDFTGIKTGFLDISKPKWAIRISFDWNVPGIAHYKFDCSSFNQ